MSCLPSKLLKPWPPFHTHKHPTWPKRGISSSDEFPPYNRNSSKQTRAPLAATSKALLGNISTDRARVRREHKNRIHGATTGHAVGGAWRRSRRGGGAGAAEDRSPRRAPPVGAGRTSRSASSPRATGDPRPTSACSSPSSPAPSLPSPSSRVTLAMYAPHLLGLLINWVYLCLFIS